MHLIRGYIRHVTKDRISLLGELWKLFSFFVLTHAHPHTSSQTVSQININLSQNDDYMENSQNIKNSYRRWVTTYASHELYPKMVKMSRFCKTLNLIPIYETFNENQVIFIQLHTLHNRRKYYQQHSFSPTYIYFSPLTLLVSLPALSFSTTFHQYIIFPSYKRG